MNPPLFYPQCSLFPTHTSGRVSTVLGLGCRDCLDMFAQLSEAERLKAATCAGCGATGSDVEVAVYGRIVCPCGL